MKSSALLRARLALGARGGDQGVKYFGLDERGRVTQLEPRPASSSPSTVVRSHARAASTPAAPARPRLVETPKVELSSVYEYSGPSERGEWLVFEITPEARADIERIDEQENGVRLYGGGVEVGGFLLARPTAPQTVIAAVAAYREPSEDSVLISPEYAASSPPLLVVGEFHSHPHSPAALPDPELLVRPSAQDLRTWHSKARLAQLEPGEVWVCLIATRRPAGHLTFDGFDLHGFGMRLLPAGCSYQAKIEPLRLLDGSREALELARLEGIVA